MRIIDCEQGSRLWLEARAGIPTASNFHRILTAKRLTLSAAREDYLGELLAERALGPRDEEDEFAGSRWVERGKALEPEARRHYAFQTDRSVQTVGFVGRRVSMAGIHDPQAYDVGCSPDGLVGEDGGLELKVPAPHTHIAWLAQKRVPPKHVLQVQGALWVTGREYWDFMSYHEKLPPLIVTSEPDPKVQAALDEVMPAFCAELEQWWKSLLLQGVQPWEPEPEPPEAEEEAPMRVPEPFTL